MPAAFGSMHPKLNLAPFFSVPILGSLDCDSGQVVYSSNLLNGIAASFPATSPISRPQQPGTLLGNGLLRSNAQTAYFPSRSPLQHSSSPLVHSSPDLPQASQLLGMTIHNWVRDAGAQEKLAYRKKSQTLRMT